MSQQLNTEHKAPLKQAFELKLTSGYNECYECRDETEIKHQILRYPKLESDKFALSRQNFMWEFDDIYRRFLCRLSYKP